MTITTYLGCISGTSVDGLDIACIDVHANQDIQIRCGDTIPLPDHIRDELLTLANPSPGEIDRLGAADAVLGRCIGEAICAFLTNNEIDPATVEAIGSHGQTVRHRPPGQHVEAFTLQIGDPNQITETTGIKVVADFRRRDLAAGGQAAPLVPRFHQALFGADASTTVVLNVGGISNITVLSDPIIGFDTGPGNALLDIWCARHLGHPFDADGAWSAQGAVIQPLLEAMLSDPYFKLTPPKSTGREYFNAAWLGAFSLEQFEPQDVQATLCELTAKCTANVLPAATSQLLVCGGGRHNQDLLARPASQRDVFRANH